MRMIADLTVIQRGRTARQGGSHADMLGMRALTASLLP